MHCTGFIPSYDTSRIGDYHMSTHVHNMNVKRSDKVTLQCDDLSRVLLACVLVGVLGYEVLQFQILCHRSEARLLQYVYLVCTPPFLY